MRDAENEQRKHAVTVAVATAVAAEAAAAAAQAAAEVVRLTGTPLSYPQAQEVAAIKIQTAFRGYLVRLMLLLVKNLNYKIEKGYAFLLCSIVLAWAIEL